MRKAVIFMGMLALMSLALFNSARAGGARPITSNFTCTSTNHIKCITRFDKDGDGNYDRWVYVYCDGSVKVFDNPGGDGSGLPLCNLPFGFEIEELVVDVNAHDEWVFHLPVVVNGSEVCSIDWIGNGNEATCNCP